MRSEILRAVRIWILTMFFFLVYYTVRGTLWNAVTNIWEETDHAFFRTWDRSKKPLPRIQTVFLMWGWNTWQKSYLDYCNCTRCFTPLVKQNLTGFGSELISYSRTAKQKESVATHQRNKQGFFSSFVTVVKSHLLLLPLYWLRLVTVLDLHVLNFYQCTHGFLTFNVGLYNSTTITNVNFFTTSTRPRKFTLRPLTELTLQKFPKRQNSVNRFKQINQPDATISQSLLFDFYVQLNMFRASSRPSSGAQ